jgi:hypothetical protein
VHMPVEMVSRLPFLEQHIEALKASVRQILHIAVSAARGMCKQDVNEAP